MESYLFVYGTLRKDSDHPMAVFLREQGHWQGKGFMPGVCHDLGAYPGAVYLENSLEKVEGDIFLISDERAVFSELDPYEGVAPHADPPEYERVRCPVNGPGRMYVCWVYLYLLPAAQTDLVHRE
ncbi:MAG: hypothetical protein RLY31_2734 [Bacteroidota bacterium]|jgi:gamma-glutamylcyclotransferase (GGCT)/AIG2-like uncharacterized protein YtfP